MPWSLNTALSYRLVKNSLYNFFFEHFFYDFVFAVTCLILKISFEIPVEYFLCYLEIVRVLIMGFNLFQELGVSHRYQDHAGPFEHVR